MDRAKCRLNLERSKCRQNPDHANYRWNLDLAKRFFETKDITRKIKTIKSTIQETIKPRHEHNISYNKNKNITRETKILHGK